MNKNLALLFCLLLTAISALARQPETGYRGFAEWNNDFDLDISIYGGPTNSKYYTGFNTIHGYQLKPWLFVGGGLGLNFWPKEHQVFSLPIFADARVDLGKRLINPFFDVRLGGNVLRGGGIYLSPAFGLAYRFHKNFAVNVSVAYTLCARRQRYDDIIFDDPMLNHSGWIKCKSIFDTAVTLRLGVEF